MSDFEQHRQLTMPEHEECELVIWQEGERRCEYWRVRGFGVLRLYEADDLVKEIACSRGLAAAAQAALWRAEIRALEGGED